MEQRNNQHNGNGNGFLLGVIVGVLLTLLLTTKRGRQVLKEVTEKGIEKFSNLEQLMKDAEEKDFYAEDEVAGDDYVEPEMKAAPEAPATTVEEKQAISAVVEKEAIKETPKAKEEKPAAKEKVSVTKEVKVVVKEEKKSEVEKSPDKTTVGRRWFRGLKKRS